MGGPAIGRGQKTRELHQYFQIPVDLYQPGDIIEEDLFFLYQGKHVLYRPKNLIWKTDDRAQLDKFGVNHLYILTHDDRTHHRFLERHLHKILDEARVGTKEKATILYDTSSSLVNEIFENPGNSENFRRSMKAVKNSVDYLSRNKENFFELMSLATKNFSEYTHALHVAAYSITLARQVGIRTFNQVSAIGIASILHDIGKSKIDSRILEKGEAVSLTERQELERHAILSYEIVREHGQIPELSERIILEHHERPSGKGYPKGLTDIHYFSKIVALCDCFDLMTSDRSYQKTMSPKEAVEYLLHETQDEYDKKLVHEFILMLKR